MLKTKKRAYAAYITGRAPDRTFTSADRARFAKNAERCDMIRFMVECAAESKALEEKRNATT